MNPTNPPVRFRPKTVPLSAGDAQQFRNQDIIVALGMIEDQIKDLRELIQAPLPTTKTVMETVKPGEEGYENAGYEFGMIGNGIGSKNEPISPNESLWSQENQDRLQAIYGPSKEQTERFNRLLEYLRCATREQRDQFWKEFEKVGFKLFPSASYFGL